MMGTLTKQIYRYTHKRNMRHNENLWPWVKIERSKTGEIISLNYRNNQVKLRDLSGLHNFYTGSVLLTATGPSIQEIDFDQRPAEIKTAGVNGAWHLHQQLRFNLYFIVDMTFIDHHASIVREICASNGVLLFTTVMGAVKLIELMGDTEIQCQLAIIEDICYQTYQPSVKNDDIGTYFSDNQNIAFSKACKNIAFSNDVRQGIFDAGTVVYWALQCLGYLGFKKIYIAGLDLNNLSEPRFYEDKGNMRPSFLHNKVNSLVFPALELASNELRKIGVSIINLSLQSAVPDTIFPKQGF